MNYIKWIGILMIVLLVGCGNNYEGDFSYEVQSFSFENQDGETITKEQLEGKFWVADMIFTNCQTVCPPMTANMARLQQKLKEADLEVELISFSVDPENDTKEILKEYAAERGGTFKNWSLLTGYSFDTIKEFSIKSFKAPVEKVADSDQRIHTYYFYLVTPEGNAIKRYDGRKAAEMDQIVQDINSMTD
ncbi:SCO family protein [Radiobacillus kanasensis]|uniref:SCO family protein n=1 Tax=Radiobacillus kanasensis TaxID=2844358 RepID=UPI001E5C9B31|nr:SCO family protein [Radiobacillus kanasensis]UFU00868.1 SCO family protein [Radiobacillus kanasensis]